MKILKNLLVGLFLALLVAMVTATILEKTHSTDFAHAAIYSTTWFVGLWIAFTLVSVAYVVGRKLYLRGASFWLHAAFVLILAGAFVTWKYAEQGVMQLGYGEQCDEFADADERTFRLPFKVALEEFSIEYYTGTQAPMDFVSRLTLSTAEGEVKGLVSMNNIFSYDGYRFYQSGYDRDGRGTILSVSHDPVGIAITYAGYVALLVAMIAFFGSKRSRFRALLHQVVSRKLVTLTFAALCLGGVTDLKAAPKTTPKFLPQDVAEEFGNLYILYNDRVCPMQTYAHDFTIKLYGKDTYRGLTANQVLTGWIFYYDDWKNEPMIRIKSGAVRRMMNLSTDFATIKQFFNSVNEFKLTRPMEAIGRGEEVEDRRGVEEANEKFNIVSMTVTGSAMKVFPHLMPDQKSLGWYSQTGDLPDDLNHEEWVFMRKSLDYVHERVLMNDWDEVRNLLRKIRTYQVRQSHGMLPSERKFAAEQLYNRTEQSKLLAKICLMLGLSSFFLATYSLVRRRKVARWVSWVQDVLLVGVFLFLSFMIALRGYISNHLPISNGFETMQFMAWSALAMTLLFRNRYLMVRAFGFLVAGLTLLVSTFSVSNPQVTQLMPVLESPLLSIHVVVIMIAYALLTFVMLNGISGLILSRADGDRSEQVAYLKSVSEVMLYPAIFLLTIGIFIGAVWANVSWGRYWGWDPKETWALITMLIYAIALHGESFPAMRRPVVFHAFCVGAFLCVLITYFGVNFLLGGMHSYA